ncbi:MAG: hypothetical protein AAF828_00475 [Bacteroidota bacterium]
MLAAVKRELKNLVGLNEPAEVIRRLKEEIVREDCTLFDDVIMLESRLSGLGRSSARGTVSYENENITGNSTSEGLLWVIGELKVVHLKDVFKVKQETFAHIPAYHAFAVDRLPQTEQFELEFILAEDPNQKIHFYYLYGDSRQEVQSLVHRLGLTRAGHSFKADSLDNNTLLREPLMASFKPESRGNQQLFHILLLKNLMEKFVGPVNNMASLRQKTLKDLLVSPKLAALGADDVVSILVTLDDYNWNKDVIPPTLQDLYNKFCKVDLPADAPHFYFFFGIEYRKESTRIRQEVAAAIQNRTYGQVLEELRPVDFKDICGWFSDHRPIIPPGKEAEEVAKMLFPDQPTLDMIDVETELKRIIDQHNKGLVLKG